MRLFNTPKGRSSFSLSTLQILGALAFCAIVMGVSAHAEDVLAVTTANNLVRFDASSPGTLISTVAVTGLQAGEKIVGVEFRTVSGQLYGIAVSPTPPGGVPPPVPNFTGRLYQINAVTGAASLVGLQSPPQNPLPNFSTTLTGSHYSFSYNPSTTAPDIFRVVNENGQNLQVNAGTGALNSTDSNLLYNDANSSSAPHVVAIAYNNKIVGAGSSTLYAIDSTLGILDQLGGANGFLLSVGKLGTAVGDNAGFNISPFSGTAFAALQPTGATASTIFTVDLATGTLAQVAVSGSADPIVGLAIPTPPPSFGFAATNDAVNTGTKQNPGLGKFNLLSPAVLVAQAPISGLPNGATIAGLDFRPSTAELYCITSNGNNFGLFKIDPASGNATAVNAAIVIPNTAPTATIRYAFNFDPVRDLIRFESNIGLDVRIDPSTGNVSAVDPAPAYAVADLNTGRVPNVVACAYTNKKQGATSTTLLVVDQGGTTLLITQNPQDTGTFNTQTYSNNGVPTQLTLALANVRALQIAPDGRAFVLNGAAVNLVNLVNGTVQGIGTVTKPSNSAPIAAVRFMAIPSQTAGTTGAGAGVIQFASASYNVIETNTAQITVSRTGGSSGIATIDYAIGTGGTAATPGGLATPNTDYAPLTGTLTFLDGEVSRTINVPTFDDKTLDLFKTVNLTLKNPVGATLGAQSTATLIIADKDDSDGDGFTNELETLASTDPNNASSTPFSGNPAGTTQTLTVSKLSVKLNFAKSGGDSVSVSGTVPFSGNVTGQQVLLDVGGVGGVLGRFSLDKTGSDKKGLSRPSGGTNSFKLQTSKSGGQAKFTATLSKNTFATFLPGLPNADLSKQVENLQVNLYFNNVSYQVTKPMLYSAKKGKSGSAQLKTK